jgi:nicotinamidase-related amidase
MSDERARSVYEAARLGREVARGERPAVLVVDFSCGFSDPACTLGSDLSEEIAATAGLLAVARELGVPVIFTTIAYEPSLADGGVWLQKMPALGELQLGGPWVEIDPRLGRLPGETVVVKKGASAFFGTNLAAILVSQRIDTVVLCGATTSGCVRATAIDLVQHGFPALVPRECVGDRARAPHEANLFDIQAKYADVVALDDVIDFLARARARDTRAEPAGT